MPVLMAQKMNQDQMTGDVLPPVGACIEVVHLEFFIMEERFSAVWTPTMLPLRKLVCGESEVCGFRRLSLHPLALEMGSSGEDVPLTSVCRSIGTQLHVSRYAPVCVSPHTQESFRSRCSRPQWC